MMMMKLKEEVTIEKEASLLSLSTVLPLSPFPNPHDVTWRRSDTQQLPPTKVVARPRATVVQLGYIHYKFHDSRI